MKISPRELCLCALCLFFGALCAIPFFTLIAVLCIADFCRHAYLGFRGGRAVFLL